MLKAGSYTLKRLLNHKSQRNDVIAGYTVLTGEELREPAQEIENHILGLAGIKLEESTQDRIFSALSHMSEEQKQEILAKLTCKQEN